MFLHLQCIEMRPIEEYYAKVATENCAKHTCFSCTKLRNTFKYIIHFVFLLVFRPCKFNNCFALQTRWCTIICHIYVVIVKKMLFSLAPYCLVKNIDMILATH